MNFNASNTRQRKSKLPFEENEELDASTTTSMPRKPKNYPDHPAQQPSAPPGYGMYGNQNHMGGYDPNTGTYDPNMSAGYGVPPPTYSPMAPEYQMPQMPAGWAVPNLSDPVASAAMQYGQVLVGQGTQAVGREFERIVPVARLKYYFAVDTGYVARKLGLLMFPFWHKDWSVKYEAESQPVQPRYEINAPDLYIPLMAYVTYVLVAGLVLGTQDRFTPEVLGIQASSALAWVLLELAFVSVAMYVMSVQSQLRTLDLLAFGGYKFVGTIAAVLVSLLFKSAGYWIALAYCSLSIGFFSIRSLKCQLLPESAEVQSDPYSGHHSMHHSSPGTKRRLYLLMVMAALQTVIMWRLSSHLLAP